MFLTHMTLQTREFKNQYTKISKSINIIGFLDGQLCHIVYYRKHTWSKTEWLILTHMTLQTHEFKNQYTKISKSINSRGSLDGQICHIVLFLFKFTDIS